jgi:hypothetical protein
VAVKIRRTYKGAAASTTISSAVTSTTQTSISLATSPSGWPTGKFFVVVAPGTSQEEKMCVTLSGSTLTVVSPSTTSTASNDAGRGVDDTTKRTSIASGSTIYPVATALDFDEANELTSTYSAQGQVVYQGASTFAALSIGTAGQVLKVNSGATAPEWGQIAAAGIATGAVTSDKILDGTIAAGDLAAATKKLICPVGTISAYGGASAPTGWLLCNGDAIDVGYTELIALVGANTPDMKGRVPMGKTASSTGSTLLGTGGNRKIASNHLPTHAHVIDHNHDAFNYTHDHGSFNTSGSDGTHTHTYSGDTGYAGTHNHTENSAVEDTVATYTGSGFNNYTQTGSVSAYTGDAGSHQHSYSGTTTNTGSAHAHSIDVPSHTGSIDVPAFTGNSGDGGFANDDYFQPFVAVNFIIKHDY